MCESEQREISIHIAQLTQALPFLPPEEQVYISWEIGLCETELEALAFEYRDECN